METDPKDEVACWVFFCDGNKSSDAEEEEEGTKKGDLYEDILN